MKGTITLGDHLDKLPTGLRPLVDAIVEQVRRTAPEAEEVAYNSRRPENPSTMWKLSRYRLDGRNVAGIGCFPNHASLFLYRGRELDDPAGLLQGTGQDTRYVTLRSPDDARRPEVADLLRQAVDLERRQ